MGLIQSAFRSSRKLSAYERSLDRIDHEVQRNQARIQSLHARKKQVHTVLFSSMILCCAISVAYIAKIKIEGSEGHWDHFKRVCVAVSVPAAVEAARICLTGLMQLIIAGCRKRVASLEKQKQGLLKDLRDAADFDRIFKVISKFDPSIARQMIPSTPQLQKAGSPARESREIKSHSQVLSKSGEAVMHLLQTTSQAISPMMSKLATMMEDDPEKAAAFRQVIQERNQMREEVLRLRNVLNDAGLNPNGIPLQLAHHEPDKEARETHEVTEESQDSTEGVCL